VPIGPAGERGERFGDWRSAGPPGRRGRVYPVPV